MPYFICQQCGTSLDDTATPCSTCGATVARQVQLPQPMVDTSEEHLRQLIDSARKAQQEGDLAGALRSAREALALRNDCSTTHALLGHLYEQQGNLSAARYHFRCALQVTPSLAHADETPAIPMTMVTSPARHPQTGVMMLVLIGCVLFSGLAALFAFRPDKQIANQGNILQLPTKERGPENPLWTLMVPSQLQRKHTIVARTPAAPPEESHVTVQVDDRQQQPETVTQQPETVSVETHDPTVLGPSAQTRAVATAARPTLEAADQAFFRGEYDRAVTMYEAILASDEKPGPRVYQELAWCYQQLGNSTKAAEHLENAVQGYRAILESDPESATARQGLHACEAAQRSLGTTRERNNTP